MHDAWGWGPFDIAVAIVRTVSETAKYAQIEPPPLNPFGTWFTVVAWVVLVGLNAWCFWRLLSGSTQQHSELRAPGLGEPGA